MALAFLAALSLSVMGVGVKLLQLEHLPNSMLLMARFGISFLMLLPIIALDRKFTFKVEGMRLLIIRSVLGLVAMACLFYGIAHIPLANAMLLVNTMPIYTPIFVLFFMGVATGRLVWLGIIISMLGVAVVMHPRGSDFLDWHNLIAALAGVFGAAAMVLLRLLTKSNRSNPLLFYYFLISMLGTLPWVFVYWQAPTGHQWLLLLVVGLFGGLFQLLVTAASRRTQIRIVTPVLLSCAVFAAIWDWLLWSHMPGMLTMVGAVILLAGIVVVVRYS